jgi:hypothetical protein
MMTHPLLPKLRQLRLSGIALTLDVRATQASSLSERTICSHLQHVVN